MTSATGAAPLTFDEATAAVTAPGQRFETTTIEKRSAAAVHLRDDADLDAETLRAFLAEHLAAFKLPTLVTFHTVQLPRNASGKILKRDLRDEVVAERS